MLSTDVNKDLDHIRKDIAALREDVASLANSVKHGAAARGREAIDRVEELRERARTRAADVRHSAEQGIGDHPFASIATMFGLGLALGVLLDRKR